VTGGLRLCVDFGGTNIKMGLASRGILVETAEFPITGSPSDLDAVAAAARALGAGADDIAELAVAVPGLVDAAGARLLQAHGKYEWMLGADLRAWAQGAFGAYARVENDARAALAGELATGVARGERNVALLVLGTGIGTAVAADGVLLRGASGAGGNLGGHVTVDWAGPRCNCGNVGCAEVFGGSWALAGRLRDAVGDAGAPPAHAWRSRLSEGGIGFAELFAAAEAGDRFAERVAADAVRAWGVLAVTCCHLVDPAVFVVAGGVARAGETVLGPLETYVRAHIWSALPTPRFVLAADPANAVLRGLAAGV